ncbi:MAG: hypothetical protein M1827_007692 [Pycnora praestabilis]|nr:MAG: hypothetical protein M1827_007692 [Pycnora praestabilis]
MTTPPVSPPTLTSPALPFSSTLHISFDDILIHTAKCDICNARNKSILKRCNACGWSICSPCWVHQGGDGTHVINEGDNGWTAERIGDVNVSQGQGGEKGGRKKKRQRGIMSGKEKKNEKDRGGDEGGKAAGKGVARAGEDDVLGNREEASSAEPYWPLSDSAAVSPKEKMTRKANDMQRETRQRHESSGMTGDLTDTHVRVGNAVLATTREERGIEKIRRLVDNGEGPSSTTKATLTPYTHPLSSIPSISESPNIQPSEVPNTPSSNGAEQDADVIALLLLEAAEIVSRQPVSPLFEPDEEMDLTSDRPLSLNRSTAGDELPHDAQIQPRLFHYENFDSVGVRVGAMQGRASRPPTTATPTMSEPRGSHPAETLELVGSASSATKQQREKSAISESSTTYSQETSRVRPKNLMTTDTENVRKAKVSRVAPRLRALYWDSAIVRDGQGNVRKHGKGANI